MPRIANVIRRSIGGAAALGAALVGGDAVAAAATAAGPGHLVLNAGAFDGVKYDQPAAELRVEYRSGWRILGLDGGPFGGIGPMLGAMATTDGGLLGYGGVYADLFLADRWVLSGAATVGAYEAGDGRELGGTFEFYSAATLAYRFDDGRRLGVTLGHISNAGLNDRNPGTESLLLSYSIPLAPPFLPADGR